MDRLFFRFYNAGLNNCRMSLDIGVGLALLTGRVLVPYDVKPPWSSDPLLRDGHDYLERATVLDLFDLPVRVERTHTGKAEIEISDVTRLISAPVYDSVIRSESAIIEDEDFGAFRNGREHVFTVGEELRDKRDLQVNVETLGMYSHFFYVRGSVASELRRVLGEVRPLQPYRDLSDRIANSLIPFNAVHIRRGDFRYSRLSPRAHLVTGDEVLRNLDSRFSYRDRLVVCTDSSSDEEWFLPIRKHFRDVIFLDRLLLDRALWFKELQALPYCDDSVLGIITQLVAARAKCFVGTLFSSFTALIQRLRGFHNGQSEFLFCYSDWDPQLVRFERCEFVPVQDGPYSWNRVLYPVAPSVTSWFREWPESYQTAPVDLRADASPRGTVVLRASEASVHGLSAKYERSNVNDNIGFWTNHQDYVTWDFFAAIPMLYRVEIRYACPHACDGSIYTVGLEGGAAVGGTVTATGGWTLFSSWQILGMLDVRPGKHTLAVRIVAMSGAAAMNLAGVRLVPTCD